jgi:tetratricopeptide (TPR) repeat protein
VINNELFGEEIAVEAKIGGILWGFLMGISQRETKIKWQLLLVLLLPFSIAASTLVYAPWSSQWHCSRGIYYHKKLDLDTAEKHYKTAIYIDVKNQLAQENYKLIQVDRLSVLAYNAHKIGEYTDARRYYLRILALKKNDRWALDNLKELP